MRKAKAKDSTDNLPKDFKRKMEEWQSKKDNQEQTTDDTTTSKNRKNSATGKQSQQNIHIATPHFSSHHVNIFSIKN